MRQIRVTRLFRETHNSPHVIIVHRGGARSSKSYSILQYIIWRLTNESNCKILITRKTMPALRLTAYNDCVNLLKDYGYYDYCTHSLTNNLLYYMPNGSMIAFVSIDNPERIKSTEWNIIFMEEANEFSYNDFMILKTRLSAPTKIGNKLIMALNPVNAFCWVKVDVVDKEECTEVVSNYKDNQFLTQDYIDILESIKDKDHNYWQIFGMGEWGSLDHVVYNNWSIIDKFPVPDRTIFGCDFGFNSPTAVVELGLTTDSVVVREQLYRSGLTNNDLIDWIKHSIPDNSIIYCDCAEPARIEELKRNEINAQPADKSVKDGIDFVKRHKLLITANSPNLIKEIRSYSYKTDRNNNVLEEPIKLNDHALDAIRYALYTHLGNRPEYTLIVPGDTNEHT